MSHISNHVVGFTATLCMVMFLGAAFSPTAAFGQENRTKIHGFWVAGSASVTAKADEAIVFMVIRGSGRTAADAMAQNERISAQVEQAMGGLGLKGKYRFSANRFLPGGATPTGPGLRPYAFDPRGPERGLGFEVTKYVFITFDEADLLSAAFDDRLAATIDGLAEAGAQQLQMPQQLAQLRITGPVLFTVKDPGPAMSEAVRQAEARALAMGREVARNSGKKLGKILDARVNRPLEVGLPRLQEASVLEELRLQYYSTTKDGVTIPATFAVEYSTK
jgi:uncharacterized protein YggE